jgi:hypothetical protein
VINIKSVERDLSIFSDPATPFHFEVGKNKLRVKLTRYGEVLDFLIDVSDGTAQGRHNSRKHGSVSALLASDEFANLRSFSATQHRVLSQKKELDNLIPPAGIIDPNGSATPLTLQLGREMLKPNTSESLRILLIDGPAGVGKTSFIERMAFERTKDVSQPPILHITSKGRRLSNLPDAIGKTASDLQADFNYDQVHTLARLGALQVAIDGFDELVQPDGYGSAWAALDDFIRLMGRGGPLILAGRDTFFDQQDVQKRLDKFGGVDLQMIRLHEVSEFAAKEWLEQKGWKKEELSSSSLDSFLKRPYTRRPFFLSQIAPYKSFEDLPAERGSPQAILIDELVAREANLIAGRVKNVPTEQIKEALFTLLEEMATDMAERESDTISREFLEFYCDFAFSELVSSEELSAIRHTIGSAAFIEADELRQNLRFPHSEIQIHFLARAMFKYLAIRKNFAALRSATLDATFIEAFADICRTAPPHDFNAVGESLKNILKQESFAARLTSNVVALLIGTLVRSTDTESKLELSNFTPYEIRVFDELSPAELSDLTIIRMDARGADLTNVEFKNCQVNLLLVDETVRFGTSFPKVSSLQIEKGQKVITEHSREKIVEWLTAHSAASQSVEESWHENQNLSLVKFFDRVCRRFMRQHYIRDQDSDEGAILIRDSRWPIIEKLLEAEGRLRKEFRSAKGKPSTFYYMLEPGDFLVTDDPVGARVRREVIKRAKEGAF